MVDKDYLLGENTPKPSGIVDALIAEFRDGIVTLESRMKLPFVLLQDGKSQAYYVECHIQASIAIPLIDLDATLDPEEQEQFRLQRELQPNNPAFLRMCSDAIENRHFSDVIAEYDYSYRPEIPLKVLGGQHRVEAIKRAFENNSISRYHGFRIYFGLSVDQRNEIAQIANTNIAISPDLIDRMQETVRGPKLRHFCHKTGLLAPNDDFADRKSPEGKLTVRLARTFVVNFFEGEKNKNKDLEKDVFVPYVCKSGQDDPKYLSVLHKDVWNDPGLIEAGTNFANLHKKQMLSAAQDPELNKSEFRNKAVSMAVLASWAIASGLLQNKKEALKKLYLLPKYSGDKDPLAAKFMSESSHPKDPPTYRGLGTRYSVEDRGRVTEMFLQYAQSSAIRRISKTLIESAIMSYEAKLSTLKAKELRKKIL
jgi:hypothetical protein